MAQDSVRKVDYWYVTVPDQPGAANQVLQKFATANVNLIAFLAFPVAGGKAQVDLVPVDPAAFEKAAKAAGVALSARKQAVLVQGSDRVGALAQHVARLAAKKISPTAGTAIATPGGGYGFLLWVPSKDLDAAVQALA